MLPLTPQMQRALALLASTRDQALVRLWSQWWCSESERNRARAFSAFHRLPSGELSGPALNSVAAGMNKDHWPVLLVSTATVNALVDRGWLKYTHRKRARAELT